METTTEQTTNQERPKAGRSSRGLPYGALSAVARRLGVAVTTADYRIFKAKDPLYLEALRAVQKDLDRKARKGQRLAEKMGIIEPEHTREDVAAVS